MTDPSSTTPYQHQLLLFLDTNAVHSARLYLKFARKKSLPPIGQSTVDPEAELKKLYGSRGEPLESFKTGRKIVDYLRGKSEAGVQIEYSPVSRLELVCGLLRGEAILNAANEGIPHRMWNRIDEKEIFHRLSSESYGRIQQEADDLEELFQIGGISISEADPRRMVEVWRLAQFLLGVVFLDLGDSTVYASALLAEADELTTIDGYLRWVANAIENPGGVPDSDERAYFQQTRTRIIDFISQAISISASEVHIPKAPKSW